MPPSPHGKISCNSRPNVKRKNVYGLNIGLIRAKRQSSNSQKDINVITVLSCYIGKWLLYIYMHPFQTHLTEHRINPLCKAALLHCIPVASREGRFLQDAQRYQHSGQDWATNLERLGALHPSSWADGLSMCIQTYIVQKSKILLFTTFPDHQRGREAGLKSVTPNIHRGQHSRVMGTPRPQPCALSSDRDTHRWAKAGIMPQELVHENKTLSWATAAHSAGVLLNPAAQLSNWSSLGTATSEEISSATTLPWLTG